MQSGLVESRTLLEANVLIKEKLLKMYITHLSLNPSHHKKQIDFIAGKIMKDDPPVIISGNWNMKPGGRAWRKIAEILKDCHAEAKTPCYTFPSFRPLLQLDYIFASRNIHVNSIEVIKNIPAASDHLPLKATLLLN